MVDASVHRHRSSGGMAARGWAPAPVLLVHCSPCTTLASPLYPLQRHGGGRGHRRHRCVSCPSVLAATTSTGSPLTPLLPPTTAQQSAIRAEHPSLAPCPTHLACPQAARCWAVPTTPLITTTPATATPIAAPACGSASTGSAAAGEVAGRVAGAAAFCMGCAGQRLGVVPAIHTKPHPSPPPASAGLTSTPTSVSARR